MAAYALRVWLPDRPGALGAVASRVGAVRGDVVGIEILERGAGRAIDELIVDLPSDDLVPLLVTEVGQVDGVDVEDVRSLGSALAEPTVHVLETAAALLDEVTLDGLLRTLAARTRGALRADWGAVVDADHARTLVADGPAPEAGWLAAFVSGARSSELVSLGEHGPDDLAAADLPSASAVLVVGRASRPLRARERRELRVLTRIADRRVALGFDASTVLSRLSRS